MLQDVLSDMTKVYPPRKFREVVGDITAFMNGREEQGVGGDGRKGGEDAEERSTGEAEAVEH